MYADIRLFPGADGPATAASARAAASQPAHRSGQWPELIWDLACLGEVWIETESPGLTLSHHASLAGIRACDEAAYARGADFALRMMLDRCESIAPGIAAESTFDRAAASLTIQGKTGRPLLAVRPAPDADAGHFVLRTLQRAYGTIGRRIVPAKAWKPAAAANGIHAALAFVENCADLEDGLDRLDVAEIIAALPLEPKRLRAHGNVIAVDPSLVTCAFETLADNALPIRLVCGNEAVVRSVGFAPYAFGQGPGWAYIRGDGVSLRLDANAIDSAWIHQPHGSPDRQLRCYDRDGLLITTVVPAQDGRPGSRTTWNALMNALMD